ncbi:Patatin-like protein 2 [Blattella germanica]|nr:Patatin-like protein 2 [Blattella germanica]
MVKLLLSIDGGGIRGIIPAIILAEIEKRCRKPISRIFDIIAGTSTGGIIAMGLCMKNNQGTPRYTAEDLVQMYRKHGSEIFYTNFFWSKWSYIHGAQYDEKNIEKVLNEYFGNEIMKNTLSKLLITSYDMYNNEPFFIKSWKEKTNSIKLADAGRATSAAPTYFVPKVLYIDKRKHILIDGGVMANNPAACLYANCVKLFPEEEVLLLSVATGRKHHSFDRIHIGQLRWIYPIITIMFDSGLDVVNYQLTHLLPGRYIRIQSALKTSEKLDDASPSNIKDLEELANKMILENKANIDLFCNHKHVKAK